MTLSRDLPGHHQVLSKEPDEFKEYVELMQNVQKALGVHDLIPSSADREGRKRWFRHLVANQDIPKGRQLTADILEGKRPGKGISPEYIDFFIGRETKRDLRYNEALLWEDV